jgi:hypothetical protein
MPRFGKNALAKIYADAADSLPFDFDRPVSGLRHLRGEQREPCIGILFRVRMRKTMRQVAPDISVIRELEQ